MGEAARRKTEITALKAKNLVWLESLPPTERLIANVATVTYDKVVGGLGMTEGCYNLAFFLHEYLNQKHGIEVNIVVGYINDGLWDGATSHAWVEYLNKKPELAGLIEHKEAEHRKMLALSSTQGGAAEYLRQAPTTNYEFLARIVGD